MSAVTVSVTAHVPTIICTSEVQNYEIIYRFYTHCRILHFYLQNFLGASILLHSFETHDKLS